MYSLAAFMYVPVLPWVRLPPPQSLPPFLIVPEIRPRPLVMTGRALGTIIPERVAEKKNHFLSSIKILRPTAARNGHSEMKCSLGRLQSGSAKTLQLIFQKFLIEAT